MSRAQVRSVGSAPDFGMPVELVWEDMSDDLAMPRFRPRRS